MLNNTPESYGSVTKTIHWSTAILLVVALASGLVASSIPVEDSDSLARKGAMFSFHKTLGIFLFFLAVARIAWAFSQPRPHPVHPERRTETALAETTHWVLYLSLIGVPLSGWVHHAATAGFAPILWPFGQGLPFVPLSTGVALAAAFLHNVFVITLLAAIALHVAGALKHHFVDRDLVLARMLPGRRRVPAGTPSRRSEKPFLVAFALYGMIAIAGVLFHPMERGALATGGAGGSVISESSSSGSHTSWIVDDGSITFQVSQFRSPVIGSFSGWSASIVFDEKPVHGINGGVEVVIPIDGMRLGTITDRVRSADFFNADDYPTARFSGLIVPHDSRESGAFTAVGTLELAGAAVPVSLPFSLQISGDHALANGEVVVDRRHFGMGERYTDDATVGFSVRVGVSLTARRAAVR